MAGEKKISLDQSLCRVCGGRCCQASPGVWADPQRFFALFFAGQRLAPELLRERLPELGLRLWEKSGVAMPAPLSLATGCSFHSAAGCRLPIAARPCQCLALVPDKKTLEKNDGCLCLLPKEYSRAAVRQRWRRFWLSSYSGN